MHKMFAKYLFFFPVRYFRGEHISPALREVRKVEEFSREEIIKYQLEKVNELIRYCMVNIPFYKSKYSNIAKEDFLIKDYADLTKLPIISREFAKTNMPDLLSIENLRVSRRSTSGSSGLPLVFYKDRYGSAFMDAVMYQAYSWHGIGIGDRQARFWGLPMRGRARRIERVKDFLMNRIRLSSFDLSDQAMDKYFKRLKRFKPDYFYGYPSLIYEFACYLKNNNYPLQDLNLKGVIVTGELIVPMQLDIIEEVFGAPTINEYGCTEVGIIAFQCPWGSMHLMANNIIMETLDNGSQVIEKEGIVCITELNSKKLPFIRYMLDDRAIIMKKQCDCGIRFPVIEVRSGRIDEYILTPGGDKVYDAILAYTLKKHVKIFRATQTAIDKLDIFIVREPNYTKELENEYLAKLKEALGYKIIIKFHYVDRIDHEKSGKLRYFISEVNKD